MHLRLLTTGDLPTVERWFTDAETRRWLGGPDWPSVGLKLAGPDRFNWLAIEAGQVVALIDCETYADKRASFGIVTDPANRRRGLGREAVAVMLARPELTEIAEVFVGIERGNHASEALVRTCGFQRVSDEDEDGFVYFAWSRTGLVTSPWARP